MFLAEGLRLVIEAVEQKAEIKSIVYNPALLRSEVGNRFLGSIQNNDFAILEVNEKAFH